MISALSISRTLLETGPILKIGPVLAPVSELRVLASFDRACNLVTPGGDVVALVVPEVGDGPLNVVVAAEAGVFAALELGMPAPLGGGRLQVGNLTVVLDGAATWEPQPGWQVLRQRRTAIVGQLPTLQALALTSASEDSLLAQLFVTEIQPRRGGSRTAPTGFSAGEAAIALRAGWQGDGARLEVGAARLAGLGGGLTPAGDDFLTGVMLWAWLAHPTPDAFCRSVRDAAASRTTTLSAALLRAAARGECSASWHRLLAALAGDSQNQMAAAVQDVLAHGHTSGADALAGFLWLGTAPYSTG